MLKRRARTFIDRVAAGAGLLALSERRMKAGLTILMYHRVLPAEQCADYPLASLAMPVEQFRRQVQWLAQRCDVRPVCEALTMLDEAAVHNRPLVALTFDDGYADNAEHAAAILEECRVRGTFFVTTGFVGKREPLWFDRAADAWTRLSAQQRREALSRCGGESPAHPTNGAARSEPTLAAFMEALKTLVAEKRMQVVAAIEEVAAGRFDAERYRPMQIEQARELHTRGHEIASHTVTHPILPRDFVGDDENLAAELEQSRDSVRQWTGQSDVGFCYPNGDFDTRVEQAIAAAGYTYACTTRGGLNLPSAARMRLARIDITKHRVTDHRGQYDEIAFRAEASRLREWWRGSDARRMNGQ